MELVEYWQVYVLWNEGGTGVVHLRDTHELAMQKADELKQYGYGVNGRSKIRIEHIVRKVWTLDGNDDRDPKQSLTKSKP